MRRVIFVSEPENGDAIAYFLDRNVGMRVGLGMSEQFAMDLTAVEVGKDDRGGCRSGYFPWTDEHIETLKRMRADGKAFRLIAEELGCTRSAAIGKAGRLGLCEKKPRETKPHKPRIQLYPDRQRKKYERKLPMDFDNYQPQTVDVVPLNLTIFELTATTCRWPYGDVPNMKFCGHPVDGELPYCACHCRIAYRAPERRQAA